MDDMTAFERQVAGEFVRRAGPERPVDAAAIFTAITATASPKWRFQSMFSATKFVLAGAIVALFGGFLLAGMLTQQDGEILPAKVTESPSPMRTEDPLAGMVTEEVEPGVYRVLNDGVRDLDSPPARAMAVGQDGHPWLSRAGRLIRLGEPGEHVFSAVDSASSWNTAVDAAGAFWGMHDPNLGDATSLGSFDGSAWTIHDWPDAFVPEWFSVEATPDGAVLVVSGDRAARIRNGEWTFLPSWEGVTRGQVYYSGPVATDDTVWLGCGRHIRTLEAGCEGLLRFDGTTWDVVTPVPERPDLYAGPLAIGPDGTLWVYLSGDPDDDDDRFLARLRDDGWSVFSAEDGVPLLVGVMTWGSDLSVDDDGTLWMTTNMDWDDTRASMNGRLPSPHGVASFDGSTWRQYLADTKVQQVEAVDGQVWALGDEFGNFGRSTLHIITPEAVAE